MAATADVNKQETVEQIRARMEQETDAQVGTLVASRCRAFLSSKHVILYTLRLGRTVPRAVHHAETQAECPTTA